jgi:hypothetical protein
MFLGGENNHAQEAVAVLTTADPAITAHAVLFFVQRGSGESSRC